jgi:small subunit ribosomal protein S6
VSVSPAGLLRDGGAEGEGRCDRLAGPSLAGPRPGSRCPFTLATMTQPYYETMYILRPDIPEEEVESHVNKYRDLVTEAGAEVLDNQMRGKRRLAYPIAKHREGIYVQINHNGDGQHVALLERAMRLSEDVIRYLTVKQDGPMPAPRATAASSSSEPPAAAAEATPAG